MWTHVDDDRWVCHQPDGSRNYLLRAGSRLLEMHVSPRIAWLHEYAGEAVDEAQPLAAAAHQTSTELAGLGGATDEQAWTALAEAAAS